MAEYLVHFALSKYLNRFLVDFDLKSNFRLGLFKGETELKNLELDVQEIRPLLANLKLSIVKALLTRILIKANITKLKKEPVLIQIDRIIIELEENDPNLPSVVSSTSKSQNDTTDKTKSGTATSSDKEKKKKLTEKDSDKGKKGYGILEKIVDGVRVEIGEILISLKLLGVRDASGKVNLPPVLLLRLSDLVACTTDENWQPQDLKRCRLFSKQFARDIFVFKKITGSISLLMQSRDNTGSTYSILDNFKFSVRILIQKHVGLFDKRAEDDPTPILGVEIFVDLPSIIMAVTPAFVNSLSLFVRALQDCISGFELPTSPKSATLPPRSPRIVVRLLLQHLIVRLRARAPRAADPTPAGIEIDFDRIVLNIATPSNPIEPSVLKPEKSKSSPVSRSPSNQSSLSPSSSQTFIEKDTIVQVLLKSLTIQDLVTTNSVLKCLAPSTEKLNESDMVWANLAGVCSLLPPEELLARSQACLAVQIEQNLSITDIRAYMNISAVNVAVDTLFKYIHLAMSLENAAMVVFNAPQKTIENDKRSKDDKSAIQSTSPVETEMKSLCGGVLLHGPSIRVPIYEHGQDAWTVDVGTIRLALSKSPAALDLSTKLNTIVTRFNEDSVPLLLLNAFSLTVSSQQSQLTTMKISLSELSVALTPECLIALTQVIPPLPKMDSPQISSVPAIALTVQLDQIGFKLISSPNKSFSERRLVWTNLNNILFAITVNPAQERSQIRFHLMRLVLATRTGLPTLDVITQSQPKDLSNNSANAAIFLIVNARIQNRPNEPPLITLSDADVRLANIVANLHTDWLLDLQDEFGEAIRTAGKLLAIPPPPPPASASAAASTAVSTATSVTEPSPPVASFAISALNHLPEKVAIKLENLRGNIAPSSDKRTWRPVIERIELRFTRNDSIISLSTDIAGIGVSQKGHQSLLQATYNQPDALLMEPVELNINLQELNTVIGADKLPLLMRVISEYQTRVEALTPVTTVADDETRAKKLSLLSPSFDDFFMSDDHPSIHHRIQVSLSSLDNLRNQVDLAKSLIRDANENALVKSDLFISSRGTASDLSVLRDITKRMRDVNTGLRVRTRRHKDREYPASFVAEEAVTWLVASLGLATRAHALQIARELQQASFILPQDQTFEDDFILFTFKSNDVPYQESEEDGFTARESLLLALGRAQAELVLITGSIEQIINEN